MSTKVVNVGVTDWPSADSIWLRRVGAVAAGSGVREVRRNLEIALLDSP
jgi:hypothetical protein